MSTLKVMRGTARKTKQAPANAFVGVVLQDEIVVGEKPSRLRGTRVTFTPGGRTNWHTHPVGQTLYVVSGVGRVQQEGQTLFEIMPGDTVFIPPDVRHWHGSAPGHLMCHIALSEVNDKGDGTKWMEPVTDAQYNAKAEPAK